MTTGLNEVSMSDSIAETVGKVSEEDFTADSEADFTADPGGAVEESDFARQEKSDTVDISEQLAKNNFAAEQGSDTGAEEKRKSNTEEQRVVPKLHLKLPKVNIVLTRCDKGKLTSAADVTPLTSTSGNEK